MLAKAYNGKIYVLSSCSNNCKSKQGKISPHMREDNIHVNVYERFSILLKGRKKVHCRESHGRKYWIHKIASSRWREIFTIEREIKVWSEITREREAHLRIDRKKFCLYANFFYCKKLAIFAVVDTLFEQIISQLRSFLLHSLMQFSFYRGNTTNKYLWGILWNIFCLKMHSKVENLLKISSR